MSTWTKRDIKELKHPAEDWPWDDIRVPMQNTKLNPSKSEPAYEDWIDGISYLMSIANNKETLR